MNISGLAKSTKTTELKTIPGRSVTLRKFPLGFYEYLSIKQLEGKKMQFDSDGKVVGVDSYGTYDIDLYVDQIFNGLASWDLLDGDYTLPLTRENILGLVKDYAVLALELVTLISDFNSPVVDKPKKK